MNVNANVKPSVGFFEAIKLAFQKCLQFKGRSRRSEYWYYVLFLILVSIFLGWIPLIGQLLSIILALVQIPLLFRRLHDTGHSGWWWGAPIIMFIIALLAPIITTGAMAASGVSDPVTLIVSIFTNPVSIVLGIAIMIVQLCSFIFTLMDSHIGENKYGPSPKYSFASADTKAAEATKSDFDKVLDTVGKTIDDVTDQAADKVSDAVDDIKDATDDVVDKVKDVADDAVDKVKDVAGDVKEAADDLIDKAKDTFTKTGDDDVEK